MAARESPVAIAIAIAAAFYRPSHTPNNCVSATNQNSVALAIAVVASCCCSRDPSAFAAACAR